MVTITHQEIFERYIYAGAFSRDPDAFAELFTADGVYEAPLVPDGHALTRRLVGREAIRAGIVAYQQELVTPGRINVEASSHALHDTADPDVFIAEIDARYDVPSGLRTTVSLVQIFRVRDGKITELRDYFSVPTGSPGGAPSPVSRA